ncbi:MAG: branched-chain amino acid ABC transporter substrate-binding protein [Desulfomicrobium sp.]|jgi:branched-chain amino acid transport system substrate-binding protein|nr:branched-chain amino acid ABC transporter substrate-binding protein [Desulfomicrobium sp.]NLV96800.1 branched-chain amino acid ABC transporter substrate-binding protein [Desulfovibrionales bacterium]
MKKRLCVLGCLTLVMLLLALGSAWAKTIRIGLMCPLTGSWASEGQDMKQIVELLVGETNKAGGINGHQIELIVEDDGGDPRQAGLAATSLTTKDIVAVIGTYGSSVTEASQNIYAESDILQVATGSTSIRLSEKGLPLFFRTCPRDDEQGLVAAKILDDLGFTKIAILHDNTSYAKGLADEGKALLEKNGKDIVFYDALTPGERDYNAILTKVKSTNPEVIFFTGYYPEAGMLLRQKMEAGWDVPMLGGDATNNPDLVKIAGNKAAEGYLFLSPPVPGDLDTPEAKDFLAAYQGAYGSEPGSVWAVLAGDAYRVLVEAIAKTDDPSSANLASYLKTTLKDFSGLTGKISFNDKGDRVGDLYRVYKVDGEGRFVLQP